MTKWRTRLFSLWILSLAVLTVSIVTGRNKVHAEEASTSDQTYTIQNDANGGWGTMDPQTVELNEPFSLAGLGFEFGDCPFMGWLLKRDSDGAWYVEGQGFMSPEERDAGGYTNMRFSNGFTFEYGIDASWLDGDGSAESFTFVAEWGSWQIDLEDATADPINPQFYTGDPLYPRLFLYHHGNLLERGIRRDQVPDRRGLRHRPVLGPVAREPLRRW